MGWVEIGAKVEDNAVSGSVPVEAPKNRVVMVAGPAGSQVGLTVKRLRRSAINACSQLAGAERGVRFSEYVTRASLAHEKNQGIRILDFEDGRVEVKLLFVQADGVGAMVTSEVYDALDDATLAEIFRIATTPDAQLTEAQRGN